MRPLPAIAAPSHHMCGVYTAAARAHAAGVLIDIAETERVERGGGGGEREGLCFFYLKEVREIM